MSYIRDIHCLTNLKSYHGTILFDRTIVACCYCIMQDDSESCSANNGQYYWEMEYEIDSVSNHVSLDFCEWNESNYYYFASQPDSSDVLDIQIGFRHIMSDINDEITMNFYGIWPKVFLDSLDDTKLAESFFRGTSFILKDSTFINHPERVICGPGELIDVTLNETCPWLVSLSMRQQNINSREVAASHSSIQILDLHKIDDYNYIIEGTIELTAESLYAPLHAIKITNGRFRMPIQIPTVQQLLARLEED